MTVKAVVDAQLHKEQNKLHLSLFGFWVIDDVNVGWVVVDW